MSGGDQGIEKFSSSIERWNAPRSSTEPPVVLEPEHPLMQKFQQALHQYLVKENNRVSNEILNLSADLKQKKRSYEDQMSHEVYSLEQEVAQQRSTIMKYEESLEKVLKIRTEKEDAVRLNKDTYKEQLDNLNKDKVKDRELQGELEALSLLCRQYEAWQLDTDSELAVSQRISEKMAEEKRRLAEEKRELDVMVYKLTAQVWHLQSQLSLLDDQLNAKSAELDGTRGRVAEGTADLEALDAEHRRLMQAWASVIVNITQRDSVYTAVADEYRTIQNDFQTLVAGIESLKKEIASQMQRHEGIVIMRDRATYDLADCLKAVSMEEKKRQNLESAVAETTAALELTEKDFNQSKNEHTGYMSSLKAITRELEKLIEEKLRLENETLEGLQDRLTSDKAAENMAATIRALKEAARKQELAMLAAENQQAKMLLDMEKQKAKNAELSAVVAKERAVAEVKEAATVSLEAKVVEKLNLVERKQKNVLHINANITTLLAAMEGKEMSPVERQIEELEKTIADSSEQAKILQQDWLRMQGNVVQLTGQLHKQLADISLATKQIQILETKNTKLENEINMLLTEETGVARSLEVLQAKVELLHQQKCNDQQYTDRLQADFQHLTQEYMGQLKDAEVLTLKIEEEIKDLEVEKEQLAGDLHKTRREVLAWQKRGIMAIETKQKVDEEKSSTGEVGRMKLEIHRMQVRRQQLERTAGRLATDLAQSVGRREAAVVRSRTQVPAAPLRRSLPTRLKDKRSDLRRVHQETEVNNNLIESMAKEREYIEKLMDEKETAIAELEGDIERLSKDIEIAQIKKQSRLEMIIRQQRLATRCCALAEGRGRLSTRAMSAVAAELARQTQLRSQLVALTRHLHQDLPEHRDRLLRALACLNTNSKAGTPIEGSPDRSSRSEGSRSEGSQSEGTRSKCSRSEGVQSRGESPSREGGDGTTLHSRQISPHSQHYQM